MAIIDSIDFWKDPGFIDGAVEIPAVSNITLPTVDLTIDKAYVGDIVPSKERFFSEVKVKGYYFDFRDMSYMRIHYRLYSSTSNLPKVMTFFAWIDSVEMISDSTESDGVLVGSPVTRIRFHIDEWRTWKKSITFGSGHVKRRPFNSQSDTPVQDYQYIYKRETATRQSLFPEYKMYDNKILNYVIFSYNVLDAQDNITNVRYGCFPVTRDTEIIYMASDSLGSDPCFAPYPRWIDMGYLFDIFGIRPSQINGIWFSELPPFPISNIHGQGIGGDRLWENDGYWSLVTANYNGQTFGYWDGVTSPVSDYEETTFTAKCSTEDSELSVVNADGSRIFTLPYNMSVEGVRSKVVLAPTTCGIEIIFKHVYGTETYWDRSNASMGLSTFVPCIRLPLLSNAWSEYAYSGEREYDIDMRQLMTETGAVKQIAAGAGSGAMMGAFGSRGLIIGALGGSVGGVTNYLTETYWQNDKEQELLDRKTAQQSASILLDGSSLVDMNRCAARIELVEFVMDDYSAAQLTNLRDQMGVSVDELLSSCDTLIKTTSPTGYYNIQNLIISGSVPVSAKKWIREKFRSGVRLI